MSTPESRIAAAGASVDENAGRARQRRRTRTAIVAAAAELIRSGAEPSVGDIAEAADVSRRTVYQYFPTLDQLLIDATLGMLSQASVDAAIDAADVGDAADGDPPDGDATERVAAMIRALSAVSAETLSLGRSLIRLTVASPSEQSQRPPQSKGADQSDQSADRREPRRGYRRIGWIERALEPIRPQLEPAAYERLVSGLAMVVGWEALIVLSDLRALPPEQQTETSVWAAKVLIQATLVEAGISPR
jgi:AcrR family transcriptional regulator